MTVGVNLSDLVVPQEVTLADLHGKTVAIDAYNTIYQFMSVIRQPDGYPLCDSQGRTTSHLSGLLYRTANLIEAGIEPTFVFDGKPHPLKKATLDGRAERREKAQEEWLEAREKGDMKTAFTKAQQTSRMTPEVRQSARELLGYLGFPTVDAPADGEAEAAYMCRRRSVWAAASQDSDSLLFGTPTLVRNLTLNGRRKVPGKNVYREVKTEVIDAAQVFSTLGITRAQLVDLCILMGTDFNPGIKGIGPKKALKLVREKKDLEHILPAIGQEVPLYEEVRAIFLSDDGSDEYTTQYRPIDRDGTVEMLASYDFAADRVNAVLDRIEKARTANKAVKQQRALDSWF